MAVKEGFGLGFDEMKRETEGNGGERRVGMDRVWIRVGTIG